MEAALEQTSAARMDDARETDAQELLGLMESLLLNGASMAQAVQSDRAYYLETYSWDSVAERIMDVLRRDGYLDTNS